MKMLPKCLAAGLLLPVLVCAGPAVAQLLPLGPETVVTSGNDLGLDCPQVIGHADRSFTVVWPESPTADLFSLVGERFTGAGAPFGGPIDIDVGGLTGRRLFSVAVQNRGALGDIAVWSSYLDGSAATTWRLDSRVLSADAPALVGTPSYVRQLFPRQVGGYLAAWPAAHGNSCSLTLLDAAGHPSGPTVRLNGAAPSYQCIQSAQALDGSFAVDWFTAGPASKLAFQRFGANGKPLGTPVNLDAGRNPSVAELTSAPDGRTALGWVDYQTSPGLSGTLRIQFFTAGGAPAGPTQNVATPPSPPVQSFNPDALAMDRLGRALLVWSLVDTDPATETHTVQLWSPAGPVGPPLDLGASPVRTGVPFCASAAAAGRTWVVVWRALLPTGDTAIFVRRFFS